MAENKKKGRARHWESKENSLSEKWNDKGLNIGMEYTRLQH